MYFSLHYRLLQICTFFVTHQKFWSICNWIKMLHSLSTNLTISKNNKSMRLVFFLDSERPFCLHAWVSDEFQRNSNTDIRKSHNHNSTKAMRDPRYRGGVWATQITLQKMYKPRRRAHNSLTQLAARVCCRRRRRHRPINRGCAPPSGVQYASWHRK